MSAQGVVIHKIYNPAENIGNSWEHRKTPKIIWYHPKNNWGPIIDDLVQFEEDFNSRAEMWSGPDGYLRPDQFLDHLTVIKISDFKKTYLIHQLYHGVKTIKGTHWLWTSNLLRNEIEKLPLMVSQLPQVDPTWSNLVQFDIQPKHPDPATLHRGSSTKCAHRGWLCIAQGAIL